jgi:hypothetical protein
VSLSIILPFDSLPDKHSAQQWGCDFLETSAKTEHNINALFKTLIRSLRQAHIDNEINPNGGARCSEWSTPGRWNFMHRFVGAVASFFSHSE